MSRDLPLDREKALAAIAGGWGREATAAHPLCRCAEVLTAAAGLPPCTRCGAEQDERCREPGPGLCGATSPARRGRRVREHLANGCPVHNRTTS